jgi:hypothetical protein
MAMLSSAIGCGSATDSPQLQVDLGRVVQPGAPATLLHLSNPDQQIYKMALSTNYLFVSVDWSGVYRIPKYGGDIVPLQEDRNALFRHLAIAGDNVVWDQITFPPGKTYTRVHSQPLAGGPTTTIAEGSFAISDSGGIAPSGGYLYWVDYGASSSGSSLERVASTGGAREPVLAFGAETNVPHWVADDEGVYFTTVTTSSPKADNCWVQEVLDPAQGPAQLAPCPTSDSLAAGTSADVVYLRSEHAIWQVSKRDLTVPVTAIETLPDDGHLYAVGFDDANVYANVLSDTAGGWAWLSFPKTSGPMTALADATICPNIGSSSAIASDVAYLYLLCGSFDRVVMVPKPAP